MQLNGCILFSRLTRKSPLAYVQLLTFRFGHYLDFLSFITNKHFALYFSFIFVYLY